MPGFTFGLDLPAMGLHQLLGDRQPQPAGGAAGMRTGTVAAPETVENEGQVLRRNALPGVRTRIRTAPSSSSARRVIVPPEEVWRSAFTTRFARTWSRRRASARMTSFAGSPVSLQAQIDTLGFGLAAEAGDHIGKQVSHLNLLQLERQLTGLRQRQGLQVLDQTRQLAGLIKRGAQVLFAGLVDAVQDPLQVALDDVQRGAQLMGHISSQVATLLVGALEFTGHAVEGSGQASHIPGSPFRDLRAEVPIRHRIRSRHQVGERGAKSTEGPADHCSE